MKNIDLTAQGWRDYELLDSGGNRKLERYGQYILVRPETQALWEPAHPELWENIHAEFLWTEGKGSWKTKGTMPETCELAWEDVRFKMKLTSFKHTGIFPEQEPNWQWLKERVSKLNNPKVLNLFGYTGIASIVAAKSGAQTTHVEASKQSNTWAKENAALSEIGDGGIRYITDDALKFAEREVRRSATYDGIILDPPAFGRGAKGEVWRIEESLVPLLRALEKLLAKKSGAFFLLNGYAAGYSPTSLLQAVENFFPNANGEFGELNIKESKSERRIPSGIYVRFMR